ncbi:unnamed protein product [Lactuca saligna]|uniref:GRF-type domain-containing protein n=1 Tax=Lactuca saligna TaxID=75948 RepID=A0AA35YIX6_LACSI|nr:unnamed protein product [Lactuca saligna]
MEPLIEQNAISSYPKLGQCRPPETLFLIVKTQAMSFLSTRSSNILRLGHHGHDEQCPPCKCKNGINVERIAWTDDNPTCKFWNCKNSVSSDGPSCKFFKWKDEEMEEEYYKDHLCKMRYEELMEVEKDGFEIELMELNKKNPIMKTYLRYAKCLILVLFIAIIRMWLKSDFGG